MRTKLNGLIREEKGAALVLTLVLLLIGGLIIAPLLGHMGTGHTAGQVHEKRMDEFYAADAGVEDAMWRIQYNPPDSWEIHDDPVGSYIYQYPDVLHVNGKSVNVTMIREDLDPTCNEELRYSGNSNATDLDGSFTTVDAYLSVYFMDFSSLLKYAIVSDDSIGVWPRSTIDGSVWLPDDGQLVNKGDITGTVANDTTDPMSYPGDDDAAQLIEYYWDQVKHLPLSTANQILIKDTSPSEPGVVSALASEPQGGELTIKGQGWVELGGTIYVKGHLDFTLTPQLEVDLKGQTIFVEGDVTMGTGLKFIGSGCIVALGHITGQPNFACSHDDFVLIMSVTGEVRLQPNGTMTGCIAGKEHVQIQPGQNEDFSVSWITPPTTLNFPMGALDIDNLPPATGLHIHSWQIDTGS